MAAELKNGPFTESEGKLSPASSRAGDSIYLWHGSKDDVVLPLSARNSYHILQHLLPSQGTQGLEIVKRKSYLNGKAESFFFKESISLSQT